MARTALTPRQRADSVATAYASLANLLPRALDALNAYGPTDPRTLKAWEAVEVNGATVHRQARLLAGKSKGG